MNEKCTRSIFDVRLKDELPFRGPVVKHKVLDNDDIQGKEIFVVGDVHGCLDELKALLNTYELMGGDRVLHDKIVILCGDLVTKGPQNVETLAFVKQSGILAVRGNQDDKVLRKFFSKNHAEINKPKNLWIKDLSSDHIEFLLDLPYSISIPSLNAVIVHAGMLPNIPVEKQNTFVLTFMRSLRVCGDELVPVAECLDGQPWINKWRGPCHVYFGHDARSGLQLSEFATGLDTGCVYGNKLTGKFISGRRSGLIVDIESYQEYHQPKKITSSCGL